MGTLGWFRVEELIKILLMGPPHLFLLHPIAQRWHQRDSWRVRSRAQRSTEVAPKGLPEAGSEDQRC